MASREEQEYSSQAPAGYIGELLQKGIFPYAQKFMTDQFDRYGEADSSPFTYTGQRVAGFDPREMYGMQLQDAAIGSYRPYLGAQADLLDQAAGFTRGGLGRGQEEIIQGLGAGRGLTGEAARLARGARFTQPGLADFRSAMPDFSEAQQLTRAGAPNLDLARLETAAARPQYGGARGGLSRAELSGYGSTGGFDPRGIGSFYDPYEEDVVQQTLRDVREGLSKGDMALRDQAISSGAFGGARSRLRRGELASDAARGAAEAIGGIRSRGYEGARSAAQQAFEAQQSRMAGLGGLQAQLAGLEGGFAGQEGQAALARGQQFGALSTTEAQNALTRAAQLGSLEAQEAQAKLARGEALNQSEQMAVNNALQRGQQLGQFGQQQFGMGLQGGQGLAGLGYQGAQGLGQLGGQYAGMAQALPALQQQDIQGIMGMSGLGRGREQSLMDLNYQNFVGQYNLPMQTLQNVGSLTAALGPMAGGYGYAGATAPSAIGSYTPAGGSIPTLPPPTGAGAGGGAGGGGGGGGGGGQRQYGGFGGGLPSIYNQIP